MSDETQRHSGLSLAGAFLLAALVGLPLVWTGGDPASAEPGSAAEHVDPAERASLAVFLATHGEPILGDPYSG